MSTLLQAISQGLDYLQLNQSPVLAEKLEAYLILLHKWNQAYNLTAIREIETMVDRHVMDSLAILPWLQGKHIIDVGSGAGLPGIPLALARPDCDFVLLDSNGKKTRFLAEVKRVLALSHVEIIQSRVEDYNKPAGFDTVISRAFSNLSDMIQWTSHLVAPQGIWLAMKGGRSADELSKVTYPYRIESYQVPGVEGERCCVIIDKV